MGRKSTEIPFYRGSRTVVLESGRLPDTPLETIDFYLKDLKEKQFEWAQTYPISKRIDLLEQTLKNIEMFNDEWYQSDLQARHIPEDHREMFASYTGGPIGARMIQALIEVLKQIDDNGGDNSFRKVRQDGNRVIVDAFPRNFRDGLLFPNMTAKIHLAPGTKVDDIATLQAKVYKDKSYTGGVSLVLGAGNASSLSLTDILHKLFVEKRVVIFKVHPILEYLGPLFEKILEPFIRAGFIRIVMGGAAEGQHIVTHPLVDDIHMTGSDKTFEAIVYGRGEEGKKNKEMNRPINTKQVTAELGNVSPVIVVPGDWKDSDFDFQADNILMMLATLNGYSCCASRVLILPKSWFGSEKLIQKLEEKMSRARAAVNYYPGTNDTVSDAITCYADCAKFGELDKNKQPWLLAKNLDPNKEEPAFNREFWSTFMAQTYIDGVDREDYLMNAVKFANEKLWGTLSASIIIDPKTEKEMISSKVLQKAIDELHYGTVAVNIYPGFGLLTLTPWGGYPGSPSNNIQSGNCYVNNVFMLENIEKSVIHAPFHITPKPFIFVSNKPNHRAERAMGNFMIRNSMMNFARLLIAVMFFGRF